ncbi:MAG TPA: MBL fold metallo-hydrolase [Bryobacteraceae bacterium]|jgi:glyoxylase-like metal-dependent hydrolase (beta-lactamase superfamily II)
MRIILRFAALLISLVATSTAQDLSGQDSNNPQIQTLPVQGNVYMLVGGGANVTVQIGSDGVLLVDSNYAQLAPRIIAAIRKLSAGPVRYVVLTSVQADHTGGTEALVKLGATPAAPSPALVVADIDVLNRMVKPLPRDPPVPQALWPNDTYSTPFKDFYFNNEAVIVTHVPAAHTDGDSIVFFRKSDALSVGDIFTPGNYPVIDTAKGGSVQGLIDGLNRILDIAVPAKYQEGGTLVIPGHGRLCDEADVVEFRDMVTIIRDRVQDLIKQGKTLDQAKAAQPTRDYDTQYAAEGSSVTPDAFVESVFRSLKK